MKRIIATAIIALVCTLAGAVYTQVKKPDSKKATNIPDGFGSVNWGTLLSQTKDKVAGKIAFTDDRRIIISKDDEIEYSYGFFFPDPTLVKQPAVTEGKLYYVLIRFPYLSMDDVRKKIEEKYGAPTGQAITKNQGALIWDAEKTTIIMWIDEYELKPFCRKITYIGKEVAKGINEYQKNVFNKTELEILQKLAF